MTEDTGRHDDAGSEVQAEMAVVTDGATTVFVADFDDADMAWEAYEALTDRKSTRLNSSH